MSSFIDFIGQIFTFIWDMLTSFVNVLLLIGRGVVYIFTVVGALPTYFKVAVIPIISLAIVLMVLDRG